MRLRDFRVLTFDCYGTLIDWESGIYTALQPLLQKSGQSLSRDAALETFARHESTQEEETPSMIYSDLLATVHRRLAKEWKVNVSDTEHTRFGASVPDWPAFPDSAEALAYLKQHYQLVILSNVDRESFKGSNKRLGVEFDAIYTAQDIGSYKPDPRNFTYLLDRLKEQGIAKTKILHVAQSLFHDHVAANAIGLASAWIDRRHDTGGWGATAPVSPDVHYDFRFTNLGALANAHRTAA
jgi:2-haloacid dehalogenase